MGGEELSEDVHRMVEREHRAHAGAARPSLTRLQDRTVDAVGFMRRGHKIARRSRAFRKWARR
jgi:hypothetical protein